MKEITLNIPSSWNEVSIKDFTRLAGMSGRNPYEDALVIISILSGEDVDELRRLPATWLETNNISERLSFMAKEPEKVMPSEKLELNGAKYNVALYPSKWTAAQYLDYCSVLTEEGSKKLARIIACFTVPEGKRYGEDYDFEHVVDEIFEHMPITIALGYAGFFHLQLKSLEKAIQRYTEKKNRKSTLKPESRLYRKSAKAAKKALTSSGTRS